MARSYTINGMLADLGRMANSPVQELGRMAIFFLRGALHLFSFPLQADRIIDQVYFIGTKSVFVICLTGAFTGMVFGLQGYYTLVKVGSEGLLGAAVALSLISVAYLTIKLGKMEWFGDDYYTLDAQFTSVSGLKAGALLDMAGVEIGQVADIHLDNQRQVAIVSLKIRKGVMLTDDVIASVKTSGRIGDKYIRLTPGGSDRILKTGNMISDTAKT